MNNKARNLVAPGIDNVFLHPGEVYVAASPALVSTVLGSCVSVTLFSPKHCMGAICHGMLPNGKTGGDDMRYVDRAIRHIHEKLVVLSGGDALIAKVFGGSEMLPQDPRAESALSVGRQNVEAALRTLAELGLEPVAVETGGSRGRKIFFHTATGVVYLRHVRRTIS